MIEVLNFIAQSLAFPAMLVPFGLLLCLLILNYKVLLEQFRKVSTRTWIILIAILFLAFFLRAFSPSCPTNDAKMFEHVWRADRMLAGQPLIEGELQRPTGYAFLLTVAFYVFGSSVYSIAGFNLIISTLTVLVVFLLTFTIIKNERYSLLAALVLCLMPLHIFYSMHSSARETALFFVSLAFLLFFIAVQNKKRKTLLLASVSIFVALTIRMENLIYVLLLAASTPLFFKRSDLKKLVLPVGVLFLLLILMVPYFLNAPMTFGYRSEKQGRSIMEEVYHDAFPEVEKGATFSLHTFPATIQGNLELLLNPLIYPVLLFFFALLSLSIIPKNRVAIPVIAWFFLVFLFHGIWFGGSLISYQLYQVLALSPLAVMIGLGFFQLGNALEPRLESVLSKARKKYAPALVTVAFLGIIILAFLPSGALNAGKLEFWKGEICVFGDIASASESAGHEACFVADSCDQALFVSEKRAVSFALPEKKVVSSIEECHGLEPYYFEFEEGALPAVEGKCELRGVLGKKCSFEKIAEYSSLALHRLECR